MTFESGLYGRLSSSRKSHPATAPPFLEHPLHPVPLGSGPRAEQFAGGRAGGRAVRPSRPLVRSGPTVCGRRLRWAQAGARGSGTAALPVPLHVECPPYALVSLASWPPSWLGPDAERRDRRGSELGLDGRSRSLYRLSAGAAASAAVLSWWRVRPSRAYLARWPPRLHFLHFLRGCRSVAGWWRCGGSRGRFAWPVGPRCGGRYWRLASAAAWLY